MYFVFFSTHPLSNVAKDRAGWIKWHSMLGMYTYLLESGRHFAP